MKPDSTEEEEEEEDVTPNLKLPDAVAKEAEVVEVGPAIAPVEVCDDAIPKENSDVAVFFAPGLSALHAAHELTDALFRSMHASQSHSPDDFLKISPKPPAAPPPLGKLPNPVLVEVPPLLLLLLLKPPVPTDEVPNPEEGPLLLRSPAEAPGLAVSHATHLPHSSLFLTRHTPHSQDPEAALNLSPQPEDCWTLVETSLEMQLVSLVNLLALDLFIILLSLTEALSLILLKKFNKSPDAVLNCLVSTGLAGLVPLTFGTNEVLLTQAKLSLEVPELQDKTEEGALNLNCEEGLGADLV